VLARAVSERGGNVQAVQFVTGLPDLSTKAADGLVNWDASTLSDREGWGGFVYIPAAAVPAGVYTVQARWRRVSGAGTLTRQTSDWICLSCREVG